MMRLARRRSLLVGVGSAPSPAGQRSPKWTPWALPTVRKPPMGIPAKEKNTMRRTLFFLALASLAFRGSVAHAQNASVVTTVAVGAVPAAVAVNAATNLIYTYNVGANTVTVVNGDDNTVVTTIPMPGSGDFSNSGGEIAVNPATNMIYVHNYAACRCATEVVALDGSDNTVIATIMTIMSPQSSAGAMGLAVNSLTNTIYAVTTDDSGFATGTLWVINGDTNSITTTIPLPFNGLPSGVGVNESTNTVYVNNQQNPPALFVINGNDNTITTTISIPTVPQGGVAINPTSNRVYVACASRGLTVVNGDDNTVITTIGVDARWPDYNPITNRVYVGQLLNHNLAIIDADTNAILQLLDLQPSGLFPTGTAVNQGTGLIYTVGVQFGNTTPTLDVIQDNIFD